VLRGALQAYQVSLLSSSEFDTQRSLADEVVQVADAGGDPFYSAYARQWHFTLRLIEGDMADFRDEWKEQEVLAEQTHWVGHAAYTLLRQGMLALLEGRLDEVEPMAMRALQVGGGRADVQNGVPLQLFWLRFEQGRLGEIQTFMESFSAAHPELPVVQALLVMLFAELGLERAHELMHGYSAAQFAQLPWGAIGPIAPVTLSCAAARLGRVEDAAVLYGLLKPHQGRLAVVGASALCFGPFDHYLGILAACQNKWRQAADHYEAAITLEEQTGSATMLARTRLWQAKALVQRRTANDRAFARRVALRALADARDLGMAAVANEAQEILEVVGSGNS
jgi:hypothetical protein